MTQFNDIHKVKLLKQADPSNKSLGLVTIFDATKVSNHCPIFGHAVLHYLGPTDVQQTDFRSLFLCSCQLHLQNWPPPVSVTRGTLWTSPSTRWGPSASSRNVGTPLTTRSSTSPFITSNSGRSWTSWTSIGSCTRRSERRIELWFPSSRFSKRLSPYYFPAFRLIPHSSLSLFYLYFKLCPLFLSVCLSFCHFCLSWVFSFWTLLSFTFCPSIIYFFQLYSHRCSLI